jgi:hypothetical protein
MRCKTDDEIRDDARKQVLEMLAQKSFFERWLPIVNGIQSQLLGFPFEKGNEEALPEYCYNILELYRRTIFRTMPRTFEAIKVYDQQKLAGCKTMEEAKAFVFVNWKKLGMISGSVVRTVHFFDREMELAFQKFGFDDLPNNEQEGFEKLFFSGPWFEKQQAILQTREPGKSAEEISNAFFNSQVEGAKLLGPAAANLAYEWGANALEELKSGEAKGAAGLLDADGNLKGQRKIRQRFTYVMLLFAWPEIDAMLKSQPPKRMEDLWNWLTPFSEAKFIEIEDLDQLVSLCRPIKLKMKRPGAPRKSKKC